MRKNIFPHQMPRAFSAAAKIALIGFFCLTALATAPLVKAAAPAPSGGSSMTLYDPLQGATLTQVIGKLISTFLGFVGAIALLVFVYAGVMYMTGGSSDRIKTAVDTMKYAILGLAIIMFAYVITSFYFKALIT